jgi:hypothetical protein
VANKTVYPVPGIHLPGIKSEEQSVDETWAAELVSTGAFRYTDLSDDQKEGLIAAEVKRVLDAQQSDPEFSEARNAEKLDKADKLPPEAISVPTPSAADPSQPRAIAGIDPGDIKAAIDKATPKAARKDIVAPGTGDQQGGIQGTPAERPTGAAAAGAPKEK